MATWAQIRKAIVAAIAAASGLPASRVLWKFQDYDAPALDYIALSLSPLSTVGQDCIVESFDETRPAGQEVIEQILGVREVSLELEVFTSSVASSTTPTVDAEERAEQTRAKLLLPSIRDPLFAVGFVTFDPGPVQFIPEIVNAGFRGRATCEIRSRMPAQAYSELTGYIAGVRANVCVLLDGQDPNPLVDAAEAFTFDAPPGLGFDEGALDGDDPCIDLLISVPSPDPRFAFAFADPDALGFDEGIFEE